MRTIFQFWKTGVFFGKPCILLVSSGYWIRIRVDLLIKSEWIILTFFALVVVYVISSVWILPWKSPLYSYKIAARFDSRIVSPSSMMVFQLRKDLRPTFRKIIRHDITTSMLPFIRNESLIRAEVQGSTSCRCVRTLAPSLSFGRKVIFWWEERPLQLTLFVRPSFRT